MPSFFDLQKYAATGIASPDMTAYDKARALAAFGGGKTQTLTDVPPLSFKANGEPLISWSMKGNGQQQGTPTPDNPIQPEFVGVRGALDFDCTIMLNAGENALPFEPTNGYKIPITCAGQTTPLYLGEVSTVRRIKRFVLTGSETVSFNAKNENRGRFAVTIPLSYRGTSTPTNIISTHFPTLDSTDKILLYTGICMRSTATDMILAMSYSEVSVEPPTDATLLQNAVKSYLAAQYAAGTPVTVWYVLANEQTGIVNEPLAKIGDYCDELHSADAGVSIPTVNGHNVLTVDTELQPSSMTITYKK